MNNKKEEMDKKVQNNVKLGILVLSGLLFLILLLFLIGKNRNLFGSTFILKSKFENVQGLRPGSNVRYLGIDVGTVKKIDLLCDTVIEVTMVIKRQAKPFISKNAVTSIGTDGLMGNRLINISAASVSDGPVEGGDLLVSKRATDTDEMLRILQKTNVNIKAISEELMIAIHRINSSTALWQVLYDESLPKNFSESVLNIRMATAKANEAANSFKELVDNVNDGKGSLGAVLNDTIFAVQLSKAMQEIKEVGENANSLAIQLNRAARSIDSGITAGKGPVNALLNDSQMVIKLQQSLDNIQQGTYAFNENMEALKHHFLFKGYFNKMEKEEKKRKKKAQDTTKVNNK